MLLPSKELLSEVLGRDVDKVKGIEGNTLIYECVHSNRWYDEINIYELVLKNCMDWASSKGYDICLKELDGKYYLLTEEQILGNRVGDGFVISDSFQPFNSRIEAILKACEWIMEEEK